MNELDDPIVFFYKMLLVAAAEYILVWLCFKLPVSAIW